MSTYPRDKREKGKMRGSSEFSGSTFWRFDEDRTCGVDWRTVCLLAVRA
nr:hypothetical protein [Candidatus Freyarchaeota archaeon]